MPYQKGDIIDSQYTVLFHLTRQRNGDLYRVRDADGHLCFLKTTENPQESQLRRTISHRNVCRWIDEGSDSQQAFFVTEFISSETLANRLARTTTLPPSEAVAIATALLRLLRTIHSQGIAHQAIAADTVLLNLAAEADDMRLTDFSSAVTASTVGSGSPASGNAWQNAIDNDLMAVARLLFLALYGREAEQPVRMPALAFHDAPPENSGSRVDMDRVMRVIGKALDMEPGRRFHAADDFLQVLLGKTEVAKTPMKSATSFVTPKGNGFADVAGMDDLKKLLNEEVLYVLRNRERAERYGLDIPNGMLLYGPPGCGKTFISEKFAEEAGHHFRFVKSSDLASIYIHGTQEKIGQLFEEAREAAPCVLCFDEFEALVPRRTATNNSSLSAEVNEFLTQLNNCGKQKVFVIATTNQPLLIDTAILRRGRIDHLIYVPMPDRQARAALFAIQLKNRPCAEGIDYNLLAKRTEGYIASEIAFIANQAALRASRYDDLITEKMLLTVIKDTPPRTPSDTQKQYERMRQQIEQMREERPKIGF